MADRFCRCLHVHRRTTGALLYACSHVYGRTNLRIRSHVQEAADRSWKIPRGGCGVTCIANGSPPRSSASSLEKDTHVYIRPFSSHPRRIVDRRTGEAESPDRDPQISRKNNYQRIGERLVDGVEIRFRGDVHAGRLTSILNSC